MQPLGRKPITFPNKSNHNMGKHYINWWEYEISTESKKSERFKAKMEIKKEITWD